MKIGLFFLFLILSTACSSSTKIFSDSRESAQVIFQQDVTVTQDAKKIQIKAGDVFELDSSKVTYVESPGRTPIVLIPTAQSSSELSINLPKFSITNTSEETMSYIGEHVNEILQGVSSVQNHMAQSKFDQALAESNRLTTKFPHVSYLHVLKASCYLANGYKQEAIEILEVISKKFPNDLTLQTSLKNLKKQL